jgi:hypothetical protein
MRVNDELYSIQKFLTDLFSLENHSARNRAGIQRPYFRIELAARTTAQLGTTGWQDLSRWIIWYHASNEIDARNKSDIVTSRLKSRKFIQGYLENFNFPDPLLTAVSVTGGALVEGAEHKFALSGVRNGSETLVSSTKAITIPVGSNGVKIQLPTIPSWYSEFDIIKIYAEVSGSLVLQMGVSIVDRRAIVTHTIPSIFSSSEVPETTSAVLYKTIYIKEIDLEVSEDILEDGLWDSRLMLAVTSTGLIDLDQVVPINQVILVDSKSINTTIPVVLP